MNQNIPPVNQIYHGDAALHQRIQQLIKESNDPEFTRFLNQLGNALWNGQISDAVASAEFEKNFSIYQRKMQSQVQVQPQMQTVSNDNQSQGQQGYIYPAQFQYVGKPIEQPKKNMEFAVGAGVLGVTGAVFLLIAFVIFAMNFMSGLVKGICLYAISLAVILISELLVRKRQEKFALGMTGVGISGLFLSTIINYVYFSIFNSIIAFVLIVIITAAAFWFSYKKDSGILRIIALLGSVICLFPMVTYEGVTEFLVTGAMVLLIQGVAAFVPVKRKQNTIWILQMIILVISLFMFMIRGAMQDIAAEWLAVFVVLMIALLHMLFLRAKMYTGSVVTFCITYFLSVFALPINHMEEWKIYVFALIPLAVSTAVFTILLKHKVCRWIPYWFLHYIALYCFFELGAEGLYAWKGFTCIVILFMAAKLLSKVQVLKWSECVITVLAFQYQLGISAERVGSETVKIWLVVIMTGIFLLSSFCIRRWHAFYELIITFSAITCAFKLCPGIVRLPLAAGILIIGIFLFDLIKGKKQSSLRIYNICALSMLAICYIWLAFADNIFIYIIMLLFGITVMVFFFEEKYALTDKNKFLWVGIFLTYMFLILDVDNSIINSILLAATAIMCVGMGFGVRQKAARIYGLVLAIVTALKVALFDFSGVEAVQRMLAFLIVGILILVISYIYIRLEKKMSQEDEMEKG